MKATLLFSLLSAVSLAAPQATSRLNWFATMGDSDGEFLEGQDHDPNTDQINQGAELDVRVDWTDNLQTFTNIRFLSNESDWSETEIEEAHVIYNDLFGHLNFRAGRYFNRIAQNNHVHQEFWDFVDSNLVNSQLVGESSVSTNGAEVTFVDGSEFVRSLAISYGQVREHSHAEEEGEDEHGHGASEGAAFNQELFALKALGKWKQSELHTHQFEFSFANGDNAFGDEDGFDSFQTRLYTLDYEYVLRPSGASAQDFFKFQASVFKRSADWINHEGELDGTTDQNGLKIAALYQFNSKWQVGTRYGFVQGALDGYDDHEDEYAFEADQRQRYSYMVTRFFQPTDALLLSLRAQYNHDIIAGHEEAGNTDTVWIQAGLGWTF